MAGFVKVGVQTAIVMPPGGSPAKWVDGIAPVVPQLAELG
jgi:hypothetical protein